MPTNADVFPVIMCGGSGTRLWPASRPSRPKQFIPLVGDRSLFAQTVERMQGIDGFRELIVVAGATHGKWIKQELSAFDIEACVLLEPEGRDSAAAIAAAVAYIETVSEDGIAVVVASDHHIPDVATFQADIALATEAAEDGGIVTMGITPDAPQTAYGYIRPSRDSGSVVAVEAFVEKPDRETAQDYIREGYLWNSGNFIAGARTLTTAFETLAADIIAAARAGLAEGRKSDGAVLLGKTFCEAPKISFDYAIMEPFEDRKVVRSGITWSDLGAWNSVHEAAHKSGDGNAVSGDVIMVNAEGSHIRSTTEQLVVVEGVNGINVVVEDDVVFVSPLNRSQAVKEVVDRLKREGRPQAEAPVSHADTDALLAHWERWRDTVVLPLWWSHGYDRVNGLWREHLDPLTGQPTDDDVRARVQGRQAFVYAHAGRNGWPGPWREAVDAGFKAAQTYYAGGDGLLHTRVRHTGAMSDDTVLLYDQTFLLLALAESIEFLPDAERRALALLDAINVRFKRTDGHAGYREEADHPYQTNAHMHLFEAAQAWTATGRSPRWGALGEHIAGLALDRFIDAERGFIDEYFKPDWTRANGETKRYVEPGHQFEWAWLLSCWATTSGKERYQAAAERLFDCGIAGIGLMREIALDTLDETLTPLTTRGRLWPQTEWLKAACVLGRVARKNDDVQKIALYDKHVGTAARAVESFLTTPVSGLWWDKMTTDGKLVHEMAPASSLYHIIGAITALRDWTDDVQGG